MYIDEYTMEYLVTFYLANKGESKDIFSILPYEAAVYTGKEDDVLEKVAAVLKKSPFFRCCSIMAHPTERSKMFLLRNMLVNPFFREDAQEVAIAVSETKEIKKLLESEDSEDLLN
jgi:hypothetical protein